MSVLTLLGAAMIIALLRSRTSWYMSLVIVNQFPFLNEMTEVGVSANGEIQPP